MRHMHYGEWYNLRLPSANYVHNQLKKNHGPRASSILIKFSFSQPILLGYRNIPQPPADHYSGPPVGNNFIPHLHHHLPFRGLDATSLLRCSEVMKLILPSTSGSSHVSLSCGSNISMLISVIYCIEFYLRVLTRYAVWSGISFPLFQRNAVSRSSRSKSKPND
jgi:hypothetical protein